MSNVWSFAPRKVKQYNATIPCTVRAITSQGPFSRQHCTVGRDLHSLPFSTTLTAIGQGTTGAVQFQPNHIDFGTVLLEDSVSKPVTLINTR